MSVVFLTTFTYAMTFTYEVLFSEERLDRNAMIASVDLSDMNREEARETLQNEIRDWQEQAIVDVTWFDDVLSLPGSVFEFRVEETLDHYFSDESDHEELIVHVRETSLEDQLRSLTAPEDIIRIVDMPELMDQLEAEASALNLEISIPLRDTLEPFERLEETVTVSVSRGVDQGPLLEDWLSREPEWLVEAGEEFRVSDELSPFNGGELMNILSSGVYEAVLTMNFDIIERHTREQRYPNVPLGYDAFMDGNGRDLVFRNPMDTDYVIGFEEASGGLSITVTGYELPYMMEVRLEDVRTVDPKTKVTHTRDLEAGESRMDSFGENGEFALVMRSRFDEFGELIDEEVVSRDFYRSVNALEERSSLEPEPEPEPEEEPENDGFPENGNGEFPDEFPDNGDWDDWDDWNDWNGGNGFPDNGNGIDGQNGNGSTGNGTDPSNGNNSGTGDGSDQNGGGVNGTNGTNGPDIPSSTDEDGNPIKGM
ncbi:hypothetical protein Bsel_1438 [[Bacillus] selenitireducens MLS10]|uniref:G5 domain-containing protein n=2 Tax=Salisediminibacterium selenitireducens TaxID=85683 RepID=D6XT14_BACIE|nr:hypothetical protein Bsel_1438 [[Bacillus] selenitireducens MLS10]